MTSDHPLPSALETCSKDVRLVPIQQQERQDPLEVASFNIHAAVADFFIAIQQATTVDQAITLRERLKGLWLVVAAAESAALEKADQLCGR